MLPDVTRYTHSILCYTFIDNDNEYILHYHYVLVASCDQDK